MNTLLTSEEIHEHFAALVGWVVSADEKRISKSYVFTGFADAMEFANKIAKIADEEDHHPDLLVSWGKVEVTLSTHSVGGLSEMDFKVAKEIDALIN